MPHRSEVPIWTPPRDAGAVSAMGRFFSAASRAGGGRPSASAPYAEWHAWSCARPEGFWAEVWSFTDVIAAGSLGSPWDAVVRRGERMAPPGPRGPEWFPGARLNF